MENYPIKACVRSGFCCKKVPCGFGVWNETKTQCAYLGGNQPGGYYCEKFEEIQADPSSKISPAFGAGCCAPMFNTDRERVIRANGNVEVWVDPSSSSVWGNGSAD